MEQFLYKAMWILILLIPVVVVSMVKRKVDEPTYDSRILKIYLGLFMASIIGAIATFSLTGNWVYPATILGVGGVVALGVVIYMRKRK